MKNNTINYCVTIPRETLKSDIINTTPTSYIYATESTIPKKERISGKFDYVLKAGDLEGMATTYIKEVLYNNPATIVFWSDGTKTVCKCSEEDVYSAETGLSICILKKLAGGAAVHKLFEDWLPTNGNRVTLKNVRSKYTK